MESLALCGCACVACLWMALGSFCVPRACTRLDEMKSMQFVCSRCSATGPHRHRDNSCGSCRILKPTPRAASQRGCFVPSSNKDRMVVQPKPPAPTPDPREQRWSCVNRPKGKMDTGQKEEDDDPKTKGTRKPSVDDRVCANVTALPEPQRACTVAPSKPPVSGGNCVTIPPPKPPRQDSDPKYPIAATPKASLKKDSKDTTGRKDPDRAEKPSPADETKLSKGERGTKKESDKKGEKPRDDREINRSEKGDETVANEVVPPPKPARQGLDPKYPIAQTPKTAPKKDSKASTGRKDPDRVEKPSPADETKLAKGERGTKKESDKKGEKPRDDREMNRSKKGDEVVPPPQPARQGVDPKYPIAETPKTAPKKDSKGSTGRKDAERVDNPIPADGTTGEPDQNGERMSDSCEIIEIRRGGAEEVRVDEPVGNVEAREREDSGSVQEVPQETLSDSDSDSVYESALESDSDSVYESVRGSDSDSDSDSDSAYEMAMETLTGEERAGPGQDTGTTTETIGSGDVGTNGNNVQTTPRSRWRRLSWPRGKRAESGPKIQSRRSGTSRLRTSI